MPPTGTFSLNSVGDYAPTLMLVLHTSFFGTSYVYITVWKAGAGIVCTLALGNVVHPLSAYVCLRLAEDS